MNSTTICLLCGAVLIHQGVLQAGDAPATKPASPPLAEPFSPEGTAERFLKKPMSAGYVSCQYAGPNLALVRVLDPAPLAKGEKRIHDLLRLVANTETQEVLDVRFDYAPGELARINAARPKGLIAAEDALSIVAKEMKASGFTNYPEPSQVDVDLVGGKYYIVRFVDPNPERKPGDLNPLYYARVVVDGVSGKVLEVQLGE